MATINEKRANLANIPYSKKMRICVKKIPILCNTSAYANKPNATGAGGNHTCFSMLLCWLPTFPINKQPILLFNMNPL